MPHVDDGTLHALVDGALRAEDPERAAAVDRHLARCEDCRARLEHAGVVRTEASRILSHAAPADGPPVPDFHEVLARAGRRPGATSAARLRRNARWIRRAAWAASLVLALGTGYLIRDLAGPLETVETGERAPAAGTGSADAGAGAEQPASAPAAREPSARESSARESAEPTPSPRTAERLNPSTPARSPEPDRGISLLPSAAAVVAPSDSAPAVAADAVRAVWVVATMDEARATLDGPLYVLPRADIEELYERRDAPPAVLSLQRLESGVLVRVVQRRVAAEEDRAAEVAREAEVLEVVEEEAAVTAHAPEPPGRTLPGAEVARVARGPFVLEITASLPAELLTILGESARPAP